MDRLPEHFDQDPNLRREFCEQESWDEYQDRVLKNHSLGERATALNQYTPSANVEEFKKKMDAFERAMIEDWREDLDPETNYGEVLYLLGWTDVARRRERVAITHASFFSAAVDKGWFGIESNPN